MHIHILGICGTFMGGIALLARAMGHEVTGSDANVYPPMSSQLEAAGIELMEGYDPGHLLSAPDCVVVGNTISRGNPALEYVLDQGMYYTSGPQWLAEHVLHDRWVLAVAGTHGKTSTAALVAWILEDVGMDPGFLIGGVPSNFGVSARLGSTPFFVVEADEYDTAFFDKRSKFVHYRPRTLVLNNLEFDHADIFDDIEMIQRQFHHLLRTVPASGLIVSLLSDSNLHDVLDMGCWTPVEYFDPEMEASWHATNTAADGSAFDLICEGGTVGRVDWSLSGRHSVSNALAAMAAARHAGVPPKIGIQSLASFQGVKRRMEVRGEVSGITIYDDFAHHPTAIETTLAGLRAKVGEERIIALFEPRSNSMRMGAHSATLGASLQAADQVLVYIQDGLEWDPQPLFAVLGKRLRVASSVADIVKAVAQEAVAGDHILVMSNGGFDNVHERLLQALQQRVQAGDKA